MKQVVTIALAHAILAASVDVTGVLLGFGTPGSESSGTIDPGKLQIRVGLERPGVTGVLPMAYTFTGNKIDIVTPRLSVGVNRLHIELTYGTNTTAVLDADLVVPQNAEEGTETATIAMTAVQSIGGEGGGGGDTKKHLLTYDGGTQIKEDGNVLTHAQIYDMLMNTPDFVVLVYADHAYHPNLVTSTQIAFTCSYMSTNGDIVVERVTITSANVVSHFLGHAVTKQANGGVAIGDNTSTPGELSFAEGSSTEAIGECSHAEGNATITNGYCSHAEGDSTSASGEGAHSEGTSTSAEGDYSHAEGNTTTADGYCSHTEGNSTHTEGQGAHAEGFGSEAEGDYSHAEGYATEANGDYTHAEGERTISSGYASHAEGHETTAEGEGAHAEGVGTITSNDYAHAEGQQCEASGFGSHAEGYYTKATQEGAHAEGFYSVASADGAHVEGEKCDTTNEAMFAHVEGFHNRAVYEYQHVQGMFNYPEVLEEHSGGFMHGCGTSENDRKNAMIINDTGQIYIIDVGGYDGKDRGTALSLQQVLGVSNIAASTNTRVNNYDVPQLTPQQVTQAYNAVVAGRPVTITDATGNYHLSVMQADNLGGDLAISIIFLNVMLLTYEINGSSVDIQFKNL